MSYEKRSDGQTEIHSYRRDAYARTRSFSFAARHFLDAMTMMLSSCLIRRATRTLAPRLLPVVHSLTGTRTLSTTTLRDSYDNIIVTQQEGGVGLIQLHRPKALNALSDALFDDLIHASRALDSNEEIGCLVLTGSTKAFAAGADISEMSTQTFDQVYKKVRQVYMHEWKYTICVIFTISSLVV